MENTRRTPREKPDGSPPVTAFIAPFAVFSFFLFTVFMASLLYRIRCRSNGLQRQDEETPNVAPSDRLEGLTMTGRFINGRFPYVRVVDLSEKEHFIPLPGQQYNKHQMSDDLASGSSITRPRVAEHVEDPIICAICLDGLHQDDHVRVLPCGHVFHCVCIDPWLAIRRTYSYCPLCKTKLFEKSRIAFIRDPKSVHEPIQPRNPNVHETTIPQPVYIGGWRVPIHHHFR